MSSMVCKPTVIDYIIYRHVEDSVIDKDGRSVLTTGREPSYLAGDVCEIRNVVHTFCCNDMEKHWDLGVVGFGTRKQYTYNNLEAEVKIRTASGARKDHLSPETDICIPYCPWCTAPVITNCVADCR